MRMHILCMYVIRALLKLREWSRSPPAAVWVWHVASSRMHVVDLLRQGQGALLPEGDAGAVGTRVVAQLQVHQIDVPRQMAIVPEGDAITLSRGAVPSHVARLSRAVAAVRALGTVGRVASRVPSYSGSPCRPCSREEATCIVGALVSRDCASGRP